MQFTARHRRSLTSNFSALRPDARRTILTDEAVSFQLTLEPLEVQVLSTVTLQTLNRQGWQDNQVIWRRTPGRTVNGSLRLSAGVLAIRCRVDSVRNVPSFTPPLHVDVRTAPPILILFSMGGASGIDPPVATGNPNSQAVLQEHGISVNENLCRRRGIDDELITSLTTNRNVQCNDLCDEDCTNFFEHLALRVMNDEGLADQIRSIRGTGFCHERTNAEGMDNRIILGKWENSELEPLRPSGIRTWEQILDNWRSLGHREVILVGQSHGCAKFAGMIRDHWRWDNDLRIALFVSWDGADLFGGVSSVGPRPNTTLAFFQREDFWNHQKGNSIAEATEEHDLTGLFSHNAIARSRFVHDKTLTFIRDAVSSIRGRARGGQQATFRIAADGSIGERIEQRRLLPATFGRAFQSSGTDFIALGAPEGRLQIWRIDEHGLLDTIVGERSLSTGFTSAAFYTSGGAGFLLLVKDDAEESAIVRVNADGTLGATIYPDSPAERLTGPLRGAWDHAAAFRIDDQPYIGLARAGGDLRIVRINADGTPGAIVANPGPFGPSLNRVSSLLFFSSGVTTYLFAIDNGMSVFRMNQNGSLGPRVWREDAPLGLLDSAVATSLRLGNDQYLIRLDAVGRMQVRRIGQDGSFGQTLSSTTTSHTGRTALTAFEAAGAGYAFLIARA